MDTTQGEVWEAQRAQLARDPGDEPPPSGDTPVVNDLECSDQDVYVDGWGFNRCIFIRCRIFVRWGRFYFESCTFDDCHFYYRGPAARIVRLIEDGAPLTRLPKPPITG